MESTINVGFVEDQFLFREGMKAILSYWPNIKLVFESADGHSVIKRLSQMEVVPDVMLVDLSLPALNNVEFSGLDVTQALREAYPNMKVIILSVHEDENFIAQLIQEGAHAYLVKDSNPNEVYDAIVTVYQKGSYINDKSLKAIQHNLGQKKKPKKIDLQITKREEEILKLVCQQFTAEEIAQQLFISVKTVNGHRNNLLQKTGSKNVTGLVMYAVKNRIVELL